MDVEFWAIQPGICSHSEIFCAWSIKFHCVCLAGMGILHATNVDFRLKSPTQRLCLTGRTTKGSGKGM